MNDHAPGRSHTAKTLIYIGASLLILLIAAGLIVNVVVSKKVGEAIRRLPPSLKITYTSIRANILTGSLSLNKVKITFFPDADTTHFHEMSIDHLSLEGIHFFSLLTAHRLHLGTLKLEGCSLALDPYLLDKKIPMPQLQAPFHEAAIDQIELLAIKVATRSGADKLEGSFVIDSFRVADMQKPMDTANVHIAALRIQARNLRFDVPGAFEVLHIERLSLDSRQGRLRIDTLRLAPTVDKFDVGKIEGHQVDVVVGRSDRIEADGLDLMALSNHRLLADQISISGNHMHVFRDRRLPLQPGDKPMPVAYMKNLPLVVRVGSLKFASTDFAYEEFPKKGNKTGTLKIVRLGGTLSPFINRPEAGDPAYMTLVTRGSLEGSGSVEATTQMPLHDGDPYKVEGAFHELDVTTLNPSAENLGRIHLESGILNSLAFQFDMTKEKATGKIVGEYHNLVADKLRESADDMKVNKLKSFVLKKFIIPKDKDHTLPESKRTGKVDYKHDPSRYFSYYLLHSLLVGVKSSFSLGFLLPG